jgi:Tfp pilus assembly protein PilE
MGKIRQLGFTTIELLIIGVIVVILATLVAMTNSGVRARNRNADRQAGIDTIQNHLETYYAQTSKYPSITELNNPQWRQENTKKLSIGNIRDPLWTKENQACTGPDGSAIFASQPTDNCYTYESTATDGTPCETEEIICTQYTLTAILEGGEKYVKSSLN